MTAKEAYNILKRDFSIQELQELAFAVGIPYEDLGGTGRSGKALAMVQYAERHGIFSQLIQGMANVRDEKNQGGLKKPETTPQSSNTYIIQGDMVQGDKVGQDKIGGDKISVGDISDSSGIAIGQDSSAQVTNETTHTVPSATETTQQPTTQINIHGNVTGSAIGGGTVNAENIAGGNITIGSKEEFQSQLAALEALIQEAIANNEIPAEEVEDVQDDLDDAAKEAAKENPKAKRLTPRLEYLQEVLEKSAGVAHAAGKVGTAVLKAAPIAAGLLKAASVLF